MAKCSIKNCNAGATARITVSQDKANTKTRPVCGKCASTSTAESVKLNDNVKVNNSDVFKQALLDFAHAHQVNAELLTLLVSTGEYGVLNDIAIANTNGHKAAFAYKNAGIRYVIYIGSNLQFKHFNMRDETTTLVKYRVNEATVNDLFPAGVN